MEPLPEILSIAAQLRALATDLADDAAEAEKRLAADLGAIRASAEALAHLLDALVEPGEEIEIELETFPDPELVLFPLFDDDAWDIAWAGTAPAPGHRAYRMPAIEHPPRQLLLYSGAANPLREDIPRSWMRPVEPGETGITSGAMDLRADLHAQLYWDDEGGPVTASSVKTLPSWEETAGPQDAETPAEPASPPPSGSGAEVVDRSVANATELHAAIRGAAPGSAVLLRPGAYDDLPTLASVVRSAPITLRPLDRANPPVFGYRPFTFNSCEGLILDGLVFRWLKPRGDGSGLIDGHGRAININRGRNITLRRCLFEGYTEQIMARFADELTVEWCTLDRTQGDAIRVFEQSDDVVIRHNDMKGIAPDFSQISKFHPDYIQFAVNNPASDPDNRGAHRVLIEANSMIREAFDYVPGPNGGNHNSTSYVQTCSWFHEKLGMSGSAANPSHLWPEIAYRDFTVRGNILQGSHINGLAIAGTVGVTVEGNVIRTAPGTPGNSLPTINLYATGGRRNENVRIVNNVTPRSIAGAPLAGTGSVIEDNVVSDTAVPKGWTDPVCGHLAYPGGLLAA